MGVKIIGQKICLTHWPDDLLGVCNIQSLERSLDSGQERGTRGRVTIYRLLSHTNACMAAAHWSGNGVC